MPPNASLAGTVATPPERIEVDACDAPAFGLALRNVLISCANARREAFDAWPRWKRSCRCNSSNLLGSNRVEWQLEERFGGRKAVALGQVNAVKGITQEDVKELA